MWSAIKISSRSDRISLLWIYVCRNLCSGFHKVVDIIIKVTYNDNSYCIDSDRYRGGHPWWNALFAAMRIREWSTADRRRRIIRSAGGVSVMSVTSVLRPMRRWRRSRSSSLRRMTTGRPMTDRRSRPACCVPAIRGPSAPIRSTGWWKRWRLRSSIWKRRRSPAR